MAQFGEPGEPETQIPPITQETLAEMIGTTGHASVLHESLQEARLHRFTTATSRFTSCCSTGSARWIAEGERIPGPSCSIPHPARHEPPSGAWWRERRPNALEFTRPQSRMQTAIRSRGDSMRSDYTLPGSQSNRRTGVRRAPCATCPRNGSVVGAIVLIGIGILSAVKVHTPERPCQLGICRHPGSPRLA